jgi:hypothetical protein
MMAIILYLGGTSRRTPRLTGDRQAICDMSHGVHSAYDTLVAWTTVGTVAWTGQQ